MADGQEEEETPALEPSLLDVEEAKVARVEANLGAETKCREARSLVTERYLELIDSADAIVSLAAAARDLTNFVDAVETKVSTCFLLEEKKQEDVKEEVQRGAAIITLAPLLWRALDESRHLDAAQLYTRCLRLSTALSLSERLTLRPYVGQLADRVARSAELQLMTPSSENETDGALAAWLAVQGEGAGLIEALHTLLEARRRWIADALQEALSGEEWEAVANKLRRATRAVSRTMIDVSRLFLNQGTLLPLVRSMRDVASLEQTWLVSDALSKWTRLAVDQVRRSAMYCLCAVGGQEDARTSRLRSLFADLRADCARDSEEVASAFDLLFVERSGRLASKTGKYASKALQEASAVYAAGGKLVLRDVLSEEKEKLVLIEGDRAETVARHCDIWRAILLPGFAACVDARLCRALDATCEDFSRILGAAARALKQDGTVNISFLAERAAHWVSKALHSTLNEAESLSLGLGIDWALGSRLGESLGLLSVSLRFRAERAVGEEALFIGRVAWSLRNLSRGALDAASRCAESEVDVAIDVEQLRAAFEIADTDCDGLASAADCAEAASAIMNDKTAQRAGRGVLRPNLAHFAPSLSFEELCLVSTRSLETAERLKSRERLESCLDRSLELALESWATAVAGPILLTFKEHLLRLERSAACGSEGSSHAGRKRRTERFKKAMRWRPRELTVETEEGDSCVETTMLPCETSPAVSQLLESVRAAVQTSVAASDALAPLATPVHEAARGALLAVVAPALARILAGMDESTELGALMHLVDAFVLRDCFLALQPTAAESIFQSVTGRVDVIDLELYVPLIDKEASRELEGSKFFLHAGFGLPMKRLITEDDVGDFEDRDSNMLPLVSKSCARFQHQTAPLAAVDDVTKELDDDNNGANAPVKSYGTSNIPRYFSSSSSSSKS